MANGIPPVQAVVSCLPVIGPAMSFVYSQEIKRKILDTLSHDMPTPGQNFFERLSAAKQRVLSENKPERIAMLQQQITYAKCGIGSTLVTLAAAVAGVALGIFSMSPLLALAVFKFGVIGIAHCMALSTLNQAQKDPDEYFGLYVYKEFA